MRLPPVLGSAISATVLLPDAVASALGRSGPAAPAYGRWGSQISCYACYAALVATWLLLRCYLLLLGSGMFKSKVPQAKETQSAFRGLHWRNSTAKS